MLDDRPDAVLLDGDDETTLAAALVFAKLEVPMVRLSAGSDSQDGALAERFCEIVVEAAALDEVAAALRELLARERSRSPS